MPRKPASPLEAHLGFWLRFVSNHVSAEFQRLVEAQGVTVSEWVILRTLYSGQALSHAALIAALGMTKGAASKIVSRLEAKGLLARSYGDGNAKTQTLALSAKGLAMVPQLARLADQNDAHFFGHLSTTEQRMLAALLQNIVQRHRLTVVPVG